MKYFVLFLVLNFVGGCAHFRKQAEREADRNYVFNIDKLGGNWPEGYEVEGKFKNKGPQIEFVRVPSMIHGTRLVEAHGVWILKDNGRWIKDNKAGGQL